MSNKTQLSDVQRVIIKATLADIYQAYPKAIDEIKEATDHKLVQQLLTELDNARVTVEMLKEDGRLRAVLTMDHPDEVSGMTLFNDGTKACWSEGPGVEMQLILPNGMTETVHETSPYSIALENGIYGAHRKMTKTEQDDFDAVRNA